MFFHFGSLITGARSCRSGSTCRHVVLSLWCWRDGWWKEIDHHRVDISQADKWQPQTWKPLADRGRSEAGPSPTNFHESPFQNKRPVPGHDMAAGVSTTSCPFWPSLLYQPACWHRAEPQSLMNKPSKETWRGRAISSFNCHDSCNWQRALWELKISALTGIMYLPPSVYSLSTLMS